MKLDPAKFAAAYVALWAAHDLADHVVQTDHQAAGKATSWRYMAGHVAGYGATQALALGALRAAGVRFSPGWCLAGLASSLSTHAFLDRRWPVVELLAATGSGRFASPRVVVDRSSLDDSPHDPYRGQSDGPLPLHGPYLADQALHHVCVAIAAAIASGGAA